MSKNTGCFLKKAAVIGAGSIGGAAANHLARAGYKVWIVGSRGPAGLERFTSAWPDLITAAEAETATLNGEVVLLAVPWVAREAAFAAAGGVEAFEGKLVIDAMNPYRPGGGLFALEERSSEIVAREVGPGAAVVKAFNTLRAERLANGSRAKGAADRIAIPIAGDDGDALAMAAALIDDMGFNALEVGPLAASRSMEPGQPLYDTAVTLSKLRAMATRADDRHPS